MILLFCTKLNGTKIVVPVNNIRMAKLMNHVIEHDVDDSLEMQIKCLSVAGDKSRPLSIAPLGSPADGGRIISHL